MRRPPGQEIGTCLAKKIGDMIILGGIDELHVSFVVIGFQDSLLGKSLDVFLLSKARRSLLP